MDSGADLDLEGQRLEGRKAGRLERFTNQEELTKIWAAMQEEPWRPIP